MKMPIDKEWFEKRAAAEGDHAIGAGNPEYIPGFIPSDADRHHDRIASGLLSRIARLEADNLRMLKALEEIASLTQTENLLWWQIKAREAAGFVAPSPQTRETGPKPCL